MGGKEGWVYKIVWVCEKIYYFKCMLVIWHSAVSKRECLVKYVGCTLRGKDPTGNRRTNKDNGLVFFTGIGRDNTL